MGLAPYGQDKYSEQISRIIQFCPKNLFKVNREFINIDKAKVDLTGPGELNIGNLFTAKLEQLLGAPRLPGSKIEQEHMDIAKSTQTAFENIVLSIFEHRYCKKKHAGIVMAGGCALNGVTNAKLVQKFEIENYYWQCAAADDGLALGAAAHVAKTFDDNACGIHMPTPFLGPESTRLEILKSLKQHELPFDEYSDTSELIRRTAELITSGNVVGWYQGRAEWGPRALGNRSILADPKIKDMKDVINAKIKKRESFRPFAPSILEEDVEKLFEYENIRSPYMMHVCEIKNEYRDMYPSITHIGLTV